jgi:hypothetical protein
MEHKTLADFDIHAIGNTIQLSGCVYTDAHKTYILPFPDEQDLADKPIEVLSMTQAEWTRFLQQTDYLEVEMLAPDTDGNIVKAIVRKSQRQIEQGTSWRCYKRDAFRCCYCGIEGGDGGAALTVDHLVLWENGGPSIPANLLTACRRCNKQRGNMQYADWLRSDYYKKVSRGLIEFRRLANERVADTLAAIPRVKVKSR